MTSSSREGVVSLCSHLLLAVATAAEVIVDPLSSGARVMASFVLAAMT